jgi:hypothetical protein
MWENFHLAESRLLVRMVSNGCSASEVTSLGSRYFGYLPRKLIGLNDSMSASACYQQLSEIRHVFGWMMRNVRLAMHMCALFHFWASPHRTKTFSTPAPTDRHDPR